MYKFSTDNLIIKAYLRTCNDQYDMHIDISHHIVHTALTLVGCATMITCTLCSSANLRKRCSKEPQYFHGTSTAIARNKGNVWCYLRPTCLMRRFCLAQEGLIISLSLHLISGGVSAIDIGASWWVSSSSDGGITLPK